MGEKEKRERELLRRRRKKVSRFKLPSFVRFAFCVFRNHFLCVGVALVFA